MQIPRKVDLSTSITGAKRRILVVDDDADSLKLLQGSLEFEGYLVAAVASGEEALKYLMDNSPDLVLLDINMPGLGGIRTLQQLRSKNDYIAVIFVSAKNSSQDIVSGLDAGADDYIRKPYDVLEVLARVRAQLRIKDTKDELLTANKKLKDLVDTDELTGLLNMRAFYQRLDFEIKRGRRFGHAVGIVMMDLDNFKTVNDNHDHLFGSFVLTKVGAIIQSSIRAVDFAARYGGDEFIVGITEATIPGAKYFAERLRSTIAETLFDNGHDNMHLTASLGFTLSTPKEQTDSQSLVRAADRALYEAKESGKNKVCLESKQK